MRNACVAKVGKDLKAIEADKLYRTSQGWHSNDIAHAFREFLATLSAVTLDNQQENNGEIVRFEIR